MKRPPRKFWVVWNSSGFMYGWYHTMREAKADLLLGRTMTGPYVLAERVRQK